MSLTMVNFGVHEDLVEVYADQSDVAMHLQLVWKNVVFLVGIDSLSFDSASVGSKHCLNLMDHLRFRGKEFINHNCM